MANRVEVRSYGRVFDAIADAYDRHGLAPGATVLEIGCGTGQLTRSLLARGCG